jgi:cytochrome P450
MPAFSFRHIKDLYPVFWSKSVEAITAMTKEIANAPGVSVPVGSWASRATLDIIGLAGMGHDFQAIQDSEGELSKTYTNVFGISQRPGQRFFQFLVLVFGPELITNLPISRNREAIKARDIIRKTAFDLIKNKRTRLEKGIVEKDIIGIAIESGGFTDSELADQLMTFLAAGHETTASAMMWACYHLCKYPEMQEKLRREIREHLPSPDSGETPSPEDVDKLAYLNGVVQETLRVTPSVPLTLRVAAHDTTLIGQAIPKGSAIVLCPWAINTSPDMWGPDAAEFRPERWVASHSGGADSNYAMLTFLHGPRSCIGQKFALSEFAILLATWVGRFKMELEDGYELTVGGGATLKPKNLSLKMTIVDGW